MNYPIIFDQNGIELARLNKVINPQIVEKINGEYTFTFVTLIDELKSEYIHYDNLIEIDNNLFQITKYSKKHTLDNKIIINVLCEHISYQLIEGKIAEFNYTNKTAQEMLELALSGTNFTVQTVNVPGNNNVEIKNETNKREVLNHIANNFVGEFLFDRYNISFLVQRGQDRGVQFRTGKNIKGISKTVDNTVKDQDGNPSVTYEVEILELNELDEFKDLEGFLLGDTVKVIDDDLGVNITARILEITYNPVLKKNTNVVLGNFIEDSATDYVTLKQTSNLVALRNKVWDRAGVISEHGTIHTELLEGTIDALQNEVRAGLGTVHITDNSGILITDQPSIEASTKALRLLGGVLAISNKKDVNGSFVYRTFGDGNGFTADEIITGFLSADRISAGSIGADKIKTNELIVGQNILMGEGATISWGQVTSQPDILDSNTVTTITRNEITTATIRANQLLIGGENGSISFNSLSDKPDQYTDNQALAAWAASGYKTYIDANGVYTGTIYANQINTTGLSAEKIYQKSNPNNYGTIGGTYGDFSLFYNASEYFRVQNNYGGMAFKYSGTEFLASSGSSTTVSGTWDFALANVVGLNVVVKFE